MISKAIVRRLGYPALAAVAAALVAPAAASTVDKVEADGSYSLNGGIPVVLQDSSLTVPVDVVKFDSNGIDDAGLHSYGTSSGFFGTRSSGGGSYNVSSSFHIAETIVNESAYAQKATFHFTIAPGLLMNAVGSPLVGSDYVSAGLVFAIKRDGVSQYDSAATLTTNFAGSTYTSTGDTSLYLPSGNGYGGVSSYYTINGTSMTIDLGTIAAGASFTFSYDLSSFASGSSILSGPGFNPGGDFYVPGQAHERPPVFARGGPTTNATTGPIVDFVDEHVVQVVPTSIGAGVSQSFASTGDPFDIGLDGLPIYRYRGAGPSAAYILMERAVPEPGTWALMFAGFALTGVSLRRRKGMRSVAA